MTLGTRINGKKGGGRRGGGESKLEANSHNVTGQSLPCGEQLGVHDLQLADVSVRVALEDKIDHDLWEVKQKSARAGYQSKGDTHVTPAARAWCRQ